MADLDVEAIRVRLADIQRERAEGVYLMEVDDYVADVAALLAARDALAAERDALRTALERYGEHQGDCARAPCTDDCTCGLVAALRDEGGGDHG